MRSGLSSHLLAFDYTVVLSTCSGPPIASCSLTLSPVFTSAVPDAEQGLPRHLVNGGEWYSPCLWPSEVIPALDIQSTTERTGWVFHLCDAA